VLYFDAIVPISPLRFRSAARYRGVMVMPGRALIIVGATSRLQFYREEASGQRCLVRTLSALATFRDAGDGNDCSVLKLKLKLRKEDDVSIKRRKRFESP
jgi:hypothetical protein